MNIEYSYALYTKCSKDILVSKSVFWKTNFSRIPNIHYFPSYAHVYVMEDTLHGNLIKSPLEITKVI